MKLLFLTILVIAGAVIAEITEDTEKIDDIVEKCHCGRIYDPTCGSNGYLFASPCELNCYNNKTNSDVQKADLKACKPAKPI